ncbi:MAG: Npt1/Npt2 family nucleotide transporter [Bryobacteraceae bacterium]
MDTSVLESHHSFPVFVVDDGQRKRPLDRFLSVFADVRAREGTGVLLLATNGFLLLSAYYLLKAVREALILSQSGAEGKIYTAAAQALLLLLLVPVYSGIAARAIRIRLISWVTLFFATNLLAFAALGFQGVKIGVPYFLWLGICNNVLVGQFWAFANDLYDEHTGKRLFPIVGGGIALGGLAGAWLTAVLFRSLGPYRLMLVAAAILAASVAMGLIVNRRESQAGTKQKAIAHARIGGKGGFQLVRRDRYLFLVATLVLVLNIVNSNGEFIMSKLASLQAAAAGGDQLRFFGEFAGRFYSLQNLIVLLLQVFVVSRLFRYIGVRGALFVLPAIAFGGYALALLVPVLGIVRVVKGFENSTDYSIQNTARQALFLPTSREAKYKAKMAIDTFFTRSGDMISAAIVFLGSSIALSVKYYAGLNLLLVMLWLGLVVAIRREHRKTLAVSA